MKRGEVYYPHAFSITAAIYACGNDASMKDIFKKIEGEEGPNGPDMQSYHQILRHLQTQKCVDRETDNLREYGNRVRWRLTDEGKALLFKSRDYYRFVVGLINEAE